MLNGYRPVQYWHPKERTSVSYCLKWSDNVGWAIGRASSLYKSGCWFVGGDNLTGAFHVLLAPHPLSLNPVKSRMKTFWYRLRMRDGERRSVSFHAVIFCPSLTLLIMQETVIIQMLLELPLKGFVERPLVIWPACMEIIGWLDKCWQSWESRKIVKVKVKGRALCQVSAIAAKWG